MTNLLIQSLNSTEPILVDKNVKNIPIFKEQFQEQLSKETKKQLTEKKLEPTTKTKEEQVANEREKENESVFLESVTTVKQEQDRLLKITIPKVEKEAIQEPDVAYIKTAEVATESNKPLFVQEQQVEKMIETSQTLLDTTDEDQSIVSFEKKIYTESTSIKENKTNLKSDRGTKTPELNRELSESSVSIPIVSAESEKSITRAKNVVNISVADQDGQVTTPVILTEEWDKLEKPINLSKEESNLDFLSSNKKQTIEKVNHSDKDSIVSNKNSLLEKDGVEIKDKLDTVAINQKNTSEPTVLIDKNKAKLVSLNDRVSEMVVDQLKTPHVLSEDWVQLEQPSAVGKANKLEQIPSVGIKGSLGTEHQSLENNEVLPEVRVDENDQVIKKDQQVAVKVDTITATQNKISEPIGLTAKNKGDTLAPKVEISENRFNEFLTSRTLTKDWVQLEQPSTVGKANKLEQIPSVGIKDSLGTEHQSLENNEVLPEVRVDENDQVIKKDQQVAVKVDTITATQNKTSEPIGLTAKNKGDTLAPKVEISENRFNEFITSRILTKDWVQLEQPSTVGKANKFEQIPSVQVKDSLEKVHPLESDLVDKSEKPLPENKAPVVVNETDEEESIIQKTFNSKSKEVIGKSFVPSITQENTNETTIPIKQNEVEITGAKDQLSKPILDKLMTPELLNTAIATQNKTSEPIVLTDKSKTDQSVVKVETNEKHLDESITPRTSTKKDWNPLGQLRGIEKVNKLEQIPSIRVKDSLEKVGLPEKDSVLKNENPSLEKDIPVATNKINEKEPILSKIVSNDVREDTTKLDTINTTQNNTSESAASFSRNKNEATEFKNAVSKMTSDQLATLELPMKETGIKPVPVPDLKDEIKLVSQPVATSELVAATHFEDKDMTNSKSRILETKTESDKTLNTQKSVSEIPVLRDESKIEINIPKQIAAKIVFDPFTSPRWLTKEWSKPVEIKKDGEPTQVPIIEARESLKAMTQPLENKELSPLIDSDKEKKTTHLEKSPLDTAFKLDERSTNERNVQADKTQTELILAKDKVEPTHFDQLTTQRMLSREWSQFKKPGVLGKDSGIVQTSSVEVKDSIEVKDFTEKLIQPINNTILASKIDLPKNDSFLLSKEIVEKEQPLIKDESGDKTIKPDLLVGAQRPSVESIVTKTTNQDTIRQKVANEVNQLISKEIEQVQLKGQSSAKLTLAPEGMGDISISLELKDNVLTTKIVVDSLKIQELLTGNVPRLSDNLNRHSIQIGDVTIQLATSEQNGSRFDQKQQKKEQQSKRMIDRGSFTKSAPMNITPEINKKTGRLSILV
ncbi:flagellar hook-length control protein FliK [Carnobacterium sp. TMP28]|uniref:flagellar hook-length control protein FliK n=1 Tax=Carnobacterium sp. TMP28 TaxID=3397060 RepID=UPI0039E0402F